MRKMMYPRLAADNLRKNAQAYIPYIITCILSIGMFYIMCSLTDNLATGKGTLWQVLTLGTYVIAIFSVIFLFYTNSFLIKRRKKEFGLYNILGMEKKHIARIVTFETLYVFIISIILGLLFGVLFSKLIHLLLLHMLEFDFRFGIEISWSGITASLLLFLVIFAAMLIWSLIQIAVSQPIELLKGGQTGEREPKARWFIAILGVICLAAAYWFSITTEDPISVIVLFFGAVLLVIAGTYLLFMAGGVALLKLLRKNKNYYYKANHFISVSSMMYRMKQNAAGLATICILSTMVLVMISSTTALYFGMDDAMRSRYPSEISVHMQVYDAETVNSLDAAISNTLARHEIDAKIISYPYLSLFTKEINGEFIIINDYNSGNNRYFHIIPSGNIPSMSGKELAEDEVILYSNLGMLDPEHLTIAGKTFKVKSILDEFTEINVNGTYSSDIIPTTYVVVKDMDVLHSLKDLLPTDEDIYGRDVRYLIGAEFDGDLETRTQIYTEFSDEISKLSNPEVRVESRTAGRSEFLALYGGLFFLGIFLGLLFMMATALIIYYKQISEGYDDKDRFAIMQKVGLSRKEARYSIRSQILMMFFLPLATACMHIFFAFPAITRLLALLNLSNTGLFMLTTVLSILVFAVFYVIVYWLTAKVYYWIVDGRTAK